jgi:hypothetical protein
MTVPGPPVTTTITPKSPVAGPGPHGTLGFDHLGPAKEGMSRDAVVRVFGSPTEIDPAGNSLQDSCRTTIWKWDLPKGAKHPAKSITLDFARPSSAVSGYSVSGGNFKTDFGVGIGSTIVELKRAFGARLHDFNPVHRRNQTNVIVKRWDNILYFHLIMGKVHEITGGHVFGCK